MKILSLFVAMFCVLGCAKDGKIGPQGEQGIPGKDGSLIYSGSGSPHITTGKIGDYYLDLKNGNLYGPKSDAGWGSFFNLKGEKGEKGEEGPKGEKGTSLLSGISAPGTSQGNIGDYFLNKTDLELFGPKTAEGWGTPTSLSPDLGVRILFIRPDFHNNYTVIKDTAYSAETKLYQIDLKGKNAHAEFYWANIFKGWNETQESMRNWTLMDGGRTLSSIDYSGVLYKYIYNVNMSYYTFSTEKGFNIKYYMRAKLKEWTGDFLDEQTSLIYMIKLVPIASYEKIAKTYRDTEKYFSFSTHRAEIINKYQ